MARACGMSLARYGKASGGSDGGIKRADRFHAPRPGLQQRGAAGRAAGRSGSAPHRSAGWRRQLAERAGGTSRDPARRGRRSCWRDGAALPEHRPRALGQRASSLAGRGVRRAGGPGRAGPGPDRPGRPARLRHRGARARMSTAWCGGRTGCISGSRAGPPTSRSTRASSTTSWPAASRPGSRRGETLIKEAEEEAAIPPALASAGRPQSRGSATRWSGRRGCGGTGCTATT